MAADLATFKAKFPIFALADAVIESALAEAVIFHDVNETATLYCAAHLLALDSENTGKPDGGSGVVESEKIGPLSRNYKNQDEEERDVFFVTTSYGRRFLAIERRTPRSAIGAIVIG